MLQRTLTAVCVAALLAGGVSAQQSAAPQKPAEPPATAPRPAPSVNVRIDLTLTDQNEGTTGKPKTVSMILTDRDSGRMRTGTGREDGMLNVDVRPEIVRDNRVRMSLTLEYRPPRGEKEAAPVTQSLSTLLEDGKPLVVSQSADPGSTRSVKVELKATILK